jgi:hypothetical protein
LIDVVEQVGVKMHVEAGCRASQAVMAGSSECRSVADQVDVEMIGDDVVNP